MTVNPSLACACSAHLPSHALHTALPSNCACVLSSFCRVQLCATLWTVAPQTPLPVGILHAKILEWVACPPPGDIPDPGIESVSLISPALAGRFFFFFLPLVPPGSPSSNPHQRIVHPCPSCMDVSHPPPVLSSATTTLSPAFLTLLMNPAPRQPGSSGSKLPDKAAKNQGPWPLPYIRFPTNRLSSEELCTEGLLGSPLWKHPCNWTETQADPQ